MEPAYPKMTRAQAKLFWKTLTREQQIEFNKMMGVMNDKSVKKDITNVLVDDNEQIQRVIIQTDKAGTPDKPFYKHFKPIITGIK